MKLQVFGTHSRMRLSGTPAEFKHVFWEGEVTIPELRKQLKDAAKRAGLTASTKGKTWYLEGSWDELGYLFAVDTSSPSTVSQSIKQLIPDIEVTLKQPAGYSRSITSLQSEPSPPHHSRYEPVYKTVLTQEEQDERESIGLPRLGPGQVSE